MAAQLILMALPLLLAVVGLTASLCGIFGLRLLRGVGPARSPLPT